MKFLKQKTLSRYSPSDNAFIVVDVRQHNIVSATDLSLPAGTNLSGARAIMDITGGLRIPKGTSDQRPREAGVRTPNGGNGFIRYNTSVGPDGINDIGLEALIGGVWEVVKAPGAAAIQKQTIEGADGIETTFGPLDQIPRSENNIIVLVENVMQISDTNFNLVDNYLGPDGLGTYIVFTSPVPFGKNITIFFGYAD